MKKFSLEEYLVDPSKKVVTKEGAIVRILCTDRHSKHGQIVGLVGTNEKVKLWSKDGQYDGYLNDYDLFFADEEPELTEFEKEFKDLIEQMIADARGNDDFRFHFLDSFVKNYTPAFLAAAKKELEKNYVLLHKDDHNTAFDLGKAEALKDLPKWKNTIFTYKNPEVPNIAERVGPYYQLHYKGLWIDVDELFKKLPKE